MLSKSTIIVTTCNDAYKRLNQEDVVSLLSRKVVCWAFSAARGSEMSISVLRKK